MATRNQHDEQPDTRLPAELMLAVLDFVDQPSALALACTSRAWREVVTSLESYCLHIPIYVSAVKGLKRAAPSFFEACIATLKALVAGRPVSLEVSVEVDGTESRMSSLIDRKLRLAWLSFMLPWAMARSVVALDIRGIDDENTSVCSMLGEPAPSLKRLTLRARVQIKDHQFHLPDIFSQQAPMLQYVQLEGVPIGEVMVPALVHVVSVSLRGVRLDGLNLQHNFPCLHTLDVKLSKESDLALLNLSRMPHLRHLRVEDFDSPGQITPAEFWIHVPELPLIEFFRFHPAVFNAYCARISGTIRVEYDFVTRKVFVINKWATERLARLVVTNDRRRIAYESRFGLPNFYETLCRAQCISFHQSLMADTLRMNGANYSPDVQTLVIVLSTDFPSRPIWPPYSSNSMYTEFSPTFRLRYPALKEVQITCEGYATRTILVAEVISFGQAFESLPVPPILRLIGVRWDEEVPSDSLIHDLFVID